MDLLHQVVICDYACVSSLRGLYSESVIRENNLVVIVLFVSDFVLSLPGKGIGLSHRRPGSWNNLEVESRQEKRPSSLSSHEITCCAPVLKILVIGEDCESLREIF